MSDPRLRLLKIKTGVLRRLAKEKVTYEKEALQQRVKVELYKEQGKDAHFIKKQEEVLQESLMMIPDCQGRLLKAYEDLKKFVDVETDLEENEIFAEAVKVLQDSEPQLTRDSIRL